MPISVGFYKKIYQWLIDETKTGVAFRPFITNGNPYKSRIFLVSSNATPLFNVEVNSVEIFAEALVNRALLKDIYHHELVATSREFKGALQFEQWLEQYNEPVILTALNAYQLENTADAKRAKKEDAANFERGQEIFKEVLEEFQPEIIVLQGTTTLNQFKSMYAENLVIYNPTLTKVQLLETEGPFAELHYVTGKKALIFATRSMSYFGKDGSSFEQFKEKLVKNL